MSENIKENEEFYKDEITLESLEFINGLKKGNKPSNVVLKNKCRELNIKGYSSKNKDELIDILINSEGINHLSPLIKWSGGKSDEIKLFKSHIPDNFDTYLEPFIGGGSLFFYLSPQKSVISDLHKELILLYKSIKDGQSDEIYNFMKENENNSDTYYRLRDNTEITCDLDSAKIFYYQRKTCFRGMLRYNSSGKFNIPFGKYKTISYDNLLNKKYEELLSRTEILNESFEYIFENYNDENNFMFLDPPYDSEFTDYGYCKFDKENHKILADLFKTTKIKCLMIIGRTDFIEELYDGYIVDKYPKKYMFKIHSNRVGEDIDNDHLIIKNY